MGNTVVRISVGRYPGTAALRDGRVSPEGFEFDFVDVNPAHKAFRPMANDLAYDVSEIAIVTYLLAKDLGKPLVLLPVPVLRQPELRLLVGREDSPVHQPSDLAGRVIGVRSYSQTTATWIRGILHDMNPGLPLDKLNWRTFDPAHVNGYVDPRNSQRIPEGTTTLLGGLTAGHFDLAVIPEEASGTPGIRPALDNWMEIETSWKQAARAIPVNHLICVRAELVQERPSVRDELTCLFTQSRAAGEGVGPAEPHDALLRSVDAAARFAYEQGITRRRLTVTEVFAA
jgi:4,5-dihydroxyphthalate decarboxylase